MPPATRILADDDNFVDESNPLPVDVLLGAAALPVNIGASIDRRVSGVIDALDETVEINTAAVGSLGVQVTGTWSGTIVFEATVDDSLWNPITADPGAISSTTANGNWTIACAGQSKVRVRGSIWSSGSASITLNGSTATSTVVLGEPLPAGDAVIGRIKVTDGTDVLEIDGSGRAAIQNPPNLDAAASTFATGAKQDAAQTTLSAIDTKLGSQATAAKQDTAQTSFTAILSQLDTKTSTLSTAAKQDTAQTSLTAILAQLDNKTSTLATQATIAAIQTLLGAGLPSALSGGKLDVNIGSSVALSVSGTVTANIGTTGGLALNATLTDSSLRVGGTVAISNANLDAALSTLAAKAQFPATLGQTTKAASLSVALASDQVGAAGTAASNVMTVQGVAGMTPVQIGDNSSSLTVDSTQLPAALGQTTMAASLSVAIASNQSAVTVSGTVDVSNSFALDTTLAKLTVSQNTVLGSNTLAMVGGAVLTAAPTYMTGNINPLSLKTDGSLRVADSQVGTAGSANAAVFSVQGIASGTNLPVSQATASALQASVGGFAAAGAAVSGNPVSVSGSDGTNNVRLAVDTSGRQKRAGAANFSYITTNTTTPVKAGAGVLRAIHCTSPGAGNSMSVYDANNGTTNPIAGLVALGSTTGTSWYFDVAFTNGLTCVTTGGTPGQYTVTYD